MHSFNLVQVVVASLVAANVAVGLQVPAQGGLAVRSVRREAFLLGAEMENHVLTDYRAP